MDWGRIANLYSSKGAPPVYSNSCGPLIGDHAGNAVADLLKGAIDTVCQRAAPPTQFGAVNGAAPTTRATWCSVPAISPRQPTCACVSRSWVW